jgi:Ca2+-binding EF-hand superfamily protein
MVFAHCDIHGEGKISSTQFAQALALLGQQESSEEVIKLFNEKKKDLINVHNFLWLLAKMRMKGVNEEQQIQIKNAFTHIYKGTMRWHLEQNPNYPDQLSEDGQPYLLAADLRRVLTSEGEAEDVMNDEEVDQLIAECRPVYTLEKDGTRIGKISFEQYRTMLLDKSTFNEVTPQKASGIMEMRGVGEGEGSAKH